STAFLNRVNRRDAPDYYNVIKKPMDLNTVMKKLKTFQYNSKKEFVDDVFLIWSNCLSYNTD
ncbi:Bromodomain-containing protein, partial [Nadsonia fulvescens var. elongata DSM 6958]